MQPRERPTQHESLATSLGGAVGLRDVPADLDRRFGDDIQGRHGRARLAHHLRLQPVSLSLANLDQWPLGPVHRARPSLVGRDGRHGHDRLGGRRLAQGRASLDADLFARRAGGGRVSGSAGRHAGEFGRDPAGPDSRLLWAGLLCLRDGAWPCSPRAAGWRAETAGGPLGCASSGCIAAGLADGDHRAVGLRAVGARLAAAARAGLGTARRRFARRLVVSLWSWPLALACIFYCCWRAKTCGSPGTRRLAGASGRGLALACCSLQLELGLGTWVAKYGWPAWAWRSANSSLGGLHGDGREPLQAWVTTLHVATGSLILATGGSSWRVAAAHGATAICASGQPARGQRWRSDLNQPGHGSRCLEAMA